jgi:hypothetical protein
MSALLIVPLRGFEFISGPPVVFSNEESAIVILPESIWPDSKPAVKVVWCSFLGWWAPTSCLPEARVTGLHIWFLRASEVEYYGIEPFPIQSAAYVHDGKLRWYRGRETWEWTGRSFTELSESEAARAFRNHRFIEDVTRAAGWKEHHVDGEHAVLSACPYRLRYSRHAGGPEPTEIVIEEGPVVRRLYSRVQKWQFTWLVDRIPEFPLKEPS